MFQYMPQGDYENLEKVTTTSAIGLAIKPQIIGYKNHTPFNNYFALNLLLLGWKDCTFIQLVRAQLLGSLDPRFESPWGRSEIYWSSKKTNKKLLQGKPPNN